MNHIWRWNRTVNSTTPVTRSRSVVWPCRVTVSRRWFPSGGAHRTPAAMPDGSQLLRKRTVMIWCSDRPMDWWRRWRCVIVPELPESTNARRLVLDYPPPSGCLWQVSVRSGRQRAASFIFLMCRRGRWIWIEEEHQRQSGDGGAVQSPVRSIAVQLHGEYDLVLYFSGRNHQADCQFNSAARWRCGSPDDVMGLSTSIIAGMSMTYPNRTHSYVEMLNWSKVTKSAGGKYTCRVTSLDGHSRNRTVSFTVQSRVCTLQHHRCW